MTSDTPPAGLKHPQIPPPEAMEGSLRLYLRECTTWDEPPILGLVKSPFPGTATFHPLTIPTAMWDVWRQPAPLLRRMTRVWADPAKQGHAIRRLIAPGDTDDMVGVWLRHEGWRSENLRDAEMKALAARYGASYDFKNSTSRQEVRMMGVALLDGLFHQATQVRDNDHMEFLCERHGDSSTGHGGPLPELLLVLAAALCRNGHTP